MKKDYKLAWRKKTRIALATAFGGKCAICGYDKCINALDYHHLYPDTKDNALSIAMREGHGWDKIVLEARKCVLLCCRCHRELHSGAAELPKDTPRFNEEFANIKKVKEIEYDTCPICGGEKISCYKVCSPQCSALLHRKFDISKDELEKLIHTMPFTKIGEMFSVSDNAIRKRCKTLGIKIPKFKPGHWLKNNMSL
jgi:hypothetical protein